MYTFGLLEAGCDGWLELRACAAENVHRAYVIVRLRT